MGSLFFLPSPYLLATMNLTTVSIVLPFPEGQIVGIIQSVVFSDWLLSHRDMLLRFFTFLHGLIDHKEANVAGMKQTRGKGRGEVRELTDWKGVSHVGHGSP